ncbi:MAG TPA: 4a-hydroxytetrahydrobiopterin dehydratase [Verrucomicrobiae bacterium]|jgi:4a-hydroxytetrahydrobiopterin dehydratase|nr:4a-hydroxytetrahydrobiopterin dehydratase [Verrucomicrobiae bacterium]
MDTLANKPCIPAKGPVPPLSRSEIKKLSHQLGAAWKIIKGHHLEREYKFKDFKQALAFTVKVGKLAEKVQHHPDFYLAWGKVKLTLWDHQSDGLTVCDFIFAAKVNHLR